MSIKPKEVLNGVDGLTSPKTGGRIQNKVASFDIYFPS